MTLTPSSSHGSGVTPLVWVNVVGGVGLENGWLVKAGYGTPAFAVDAVNSLLWMRGGLDSTSASAATAFTLPVDARPSILRQTTIFNLTYLAVTAAGEVQSTTGAAFVLLDGVVLSL